MPIAASDGPGGLAPGPAVEIVPVQWWQALILGLVEGVTEYLPVSSTGHLIIAKGLLGLDRPGPEPALDAFLIVMQGGAILAVLGLYARRVGQMLLGLAGRDRAGLRLAGQILLAFMPAAVLGPILEPTLEAHLFSTWPVLAALLLGGVYMIVLDRRLIAPRRRAAEPDGPANLPRSARTLDQLTWRGALVIGLFQTVAMWPGTSRSMMSITAGVLVGLKPRDAAEFSFLLGLPTLGGACAYKLAKDISLAAATGQPGMVQQLGPLPTLVGLVAATLSAAIAIRWLVGFLNRHGLEGFGWYRIGLCAVLGALIVTGLVRIEA